MHYRPREYRPTCPVPPLFASFWHLTDPPGVSITVRRRHTSIPSSPPEQVAEFGLDQKLRSSRRVARGRDLASERCEHVLHCIRRLSALISLRFSISKRCADRQPCALGDAHLQHPCLARGQLRSLAEDLDKVAKLHSTDSWALVSDGCVDSREVWQLLRVHRIPALIGCTSRQYTYSVISGDKREVGGNVGTRASGASAPQ